MTVAVTYENGQVFQHFGHTSQFKMYEIEDGKISDSREIYAMGKGHSALAGVLHIYRVDTLICGGIGKGAKDALAAYGINVLGGVSGNADAAVEAFLNGTLQYDPDAMCDHHDHDEGHDCGGECGEHGCH